MPNTVRLIPTMAEKGTQEGTPIGVFTAASCEGMGKRSTTKPKVIADLLAQQRRGR
jgi:hypothetical protein